MGDESEPVGVAVRLKSLGDRVRQAGNIRWSDIRVSGPLGLGYAACLLASEAIGLYDWIYRQAGCTNPQAHDPRYFCPSGEHVISLWLLIAFTLVLGALVGLPAIRTHNKRDLAALAVTQLAVLGTLIWIAQESSYHVHLR